MAKLSIWKVHGLSAVPLVVSCGASYCLRCVFVPLYCRRPRPPPAMPVIFTIGRMIAAIGRSCGSSSQAPLRFRQYTRVPGRIAWYACALKDLSTEALWTQFAVRAAALVRLACCYRCVFDTLEVVQSCCSDSFASRALPADTAALLVRWKLEALTPAPATNPCCSYSRVVIEAPSPPQPTCEES